VDISPLLSTVKSCFTKGLNKTFSLLYQHIHKLEQYVSWHNMEFNTKTNSKHGDYATRMRQDAKKVWCAIVVPVNQTIV
jgi:hypothetical protein